MWEFLVETGKDVFLNLSVVGEEVFYVCVVITPILICLVGIFRVIYFMLKK